MKNEEFERDIRSYLEQYKEQENRICSMLGLELLECSVEEQYADFVLTSQDWMLNPYNGIHGGIICSAFDTCIGTGALSLRKDFISTTDITISYLRPMTGAKYRFHCEYTQVGGRLIRSVAKAYDMETGVLCATCMSSFVVTPARGTGLQV